VWLRSTGRRVKSPLPLHSGLRLRVRNDADAFGTCVTKLITPRGFDPRFPAHRAGALATRRRGIAVRMKGWSRHSSTCSIRASRAAVVRPLVGRLRGEEARSARDAVCTAGLIGTSSGSRTPDPAV
jgi:hypothetical protein